MSRKQLSPKIGIVSGIGPLAGSDVLAKVLKIAAREYGAVEDHEYPDLLLINHGIPGVDNTAALNDTFENEIVQMVKQLEVQGATVIGMACNTAHIYLDKIKTSSQTVLINLIDDVAREVAKSSHHYLLLTSNASKQQKLYHSYLEKRNVSFEETTVKQQKLLDEAIGMVMAHRLETAAEQVQQVLIEAKNAGFDAVLAGCTELPIAISHSHNNHELKVVDSNEVLAMNLVKNYYKQVITQSKDQTEKANLLH
jgi:aspartate racemase